VPSPSSGGAPRAANRTQVLKFWARENFKFRQFNAAEGQTGAGGMNYLTTSNLFLREMISKHPAQFRVLEPRHSLACEPIESWKELDLDGKRVLFLLPSDALGDNVAALLGIAALAEKFRLVEAAVFCARSAGDVFAAMRRIKTYPFWIAEKELRRYHHVFDLGHVEAQRDIEIWPVDMEHEVLAAFGLPPARAFPAEARPIRRERPLRLGILPIASSPLRTLPVAVAVDLAASLAARGEVTLFLNGAQAQGRLYREALAAAPPTGARIVEGFETIGALMRAIDELDYAVFADSGPAHMAKLFRLPGCAVYTSAPGEVLQGRFRNLARWTVPFKGPHCEAPCGLAKLRADAAGRLGCMGSLGVPLAALTGKPRAADPAAVETFLRRSPVPCVQELTRHHGALVDFVAADLERRLAEGTP
jgi:ADP-heptose:LPS heptosyltransferase